MPPVTTQASVRARLRLDLTDTVRMLPAGLALVLGHPDLPKAWLGSGVSLPVNEFDLDDVDDPDVVLAVFTILYWVLGAVPETADRCFDLVVRTWAERHWPTRTDRNSRPCVGHGHARTPEGYEFAVVQSVNGYLSVSGTTPTFTRDSTEGSPFPPRID